MAPRKVQNTSEHSFHSFLFIVMYKPLQLSYTTEGLPSKESG